MWRYLEQLALTVEEKDTVIGMLVQLVQHDFYMALCRPIYHSSGRKGQENWYGMCAYLTCMLKHWVYLEQFTVAIEEKDRTLRTLNLHVNVQGRPSIVFIIALSSSIDHPSIVFIITFLFQNAKNKK